MTTKDVPISISDAITPLPTDEPAKDVLEWQMEQLRVRHQAADAGKFASSEAVKAVVRKFIPDG